MIARAVVGALVVGAALAAPPASAQPLTVLDVAAEGVVVDAGTAPAVQPGGRMSFRQADGNPAEIAQGFVLDVRDGRALVGLRPGGTVKAGDVAIACASLTGPGSQADLRANFESLKAQLAATGGGSPDVQVAVARLESTLDGRENDIRSGACDVSQHDRDIAAQSALLQQLMAAVPSGGTGGSPLPGAAVASASPALPGAVPGAVPDSTTSPTPLPGAQGTIGAAPLPGAPDPVQGGATPAPSGGAPGFSDLLQKIFQMVQGMGGGQQASSGGAGQSSQPPSAFAPTDPGSGAAAAPPAGVTPVPSSPSFGSPDTGTGSSSGSPPGLGGPPPAGSQPTPGSGSPTAGGQPPTIGTSPPSAGSPSAPTPSQPPAPGQPPTPSRPPTTGNPPASSGVPWWAVPRRPLPLPTTGAPSGQPVTPGTASPGGTSTMTPPPGLRPAPGATLPPFAPIARAPRGEPTRPATLHGIVRDERGRPVSDAVIFIGGKRAETSHILGQEGFFVVAGVPIGRQVLTVTKDGFQPTRQFVDFQSGAVQNMSLTLQRTAPPPVLPLQRHPVAPRRGGSHQGP